MPDINFLAVLAAAISAFVVGGLWYSPLLFGNAWMKLAGLSEAQTKEGAGIVFGGAFVFSLIAAFALAWFLGPNPPLDRALIVGLVSGAGLVAASLGLNYMFERKPMALFLINGGYSVVQFGLYGLVLGLWH